ncbi:MAG: Cna domain protein [Pedosphaera sp.]|nr:Cna domain protein [Pedosphaera sp.]
MCKMPYPSDRRGSWNPVWLIAALVTLLSLPVSAQTTTISNATFASLQSAVLNGGTIILAFDGTITATTPLEISVNTIIDASGHSVTISGGNTNRIFNVEAGISLTLTNLTLQAGSVLGTKGATGSTGSSGVNTGTAGGNGGTGSAGQGGAIYNQGSTFLFNCILATNTATGGDGGAGGTGGNGSHAGNGGTGGNGGNGLGGAVYNLGFLLLSNCTFAANNAIGGNGGAGGTNGTGAFSYVGNAGSGATGAGAALYNLGTAIIVNCTFSENLAGGGDTPAAGGIPQGANGPNGLAGGIGQGGAIYNGGTGSTLNCTFYQNFAAGGAGGNGGSSASNTGGNGGNGGNAVGGSLYNSPAGSVSVTNSTFSTGEVFGGTNGLGGTGAFTGKNGSFGSSSGANIYNNGGIFRLKNSILANPINATSSTGSITDQGNNISSDGTPVFTAGNSFNNKNPLVIVPPAANGGPTLTIALNSNSPARDAIVDDSAPSFDQRGAPRPVGSGSDIGAFEFGSSTTNFSVSGKVTIGTNAFSGVTVLVGSSSTQTDTNGNYSILLPTGTYSITPQPAGYYNPSSVTVTLSNAMAGKNFNATNAGASLTTSTNATNHSLVQLSFSGIPNFKYRVQSSTNLVNWLDMVTNTAGTNGIFSYTNSTTNFSRKFFRAVP